NSQYGCSDHPSNANTCENFWTVFFHSRLNAFNSFRKKVCIHHLTPFKYKTYKNRPMISSATSLAILNIRAFSGLTVRFDNLIASNRNFAITFSGSSFGLSIIRLISSNAAHLAYALSSKISEGQLFRGSNRYSSMYSLIT